MKIEQVEQFQKSHYSFMQYLITDFLVRNAFLISTRRRGNPMQAIFFAVGLLNNEKYEARVAGLSRIAPTSTSACVNIFGKHPKN